VKIQLGLSLSIIITVLLSHASPLGGQTASECSPTIIELSSAKGHIGDDLTIAGQCFGDGNRSQVLLGKQSLITVRWSGDSVVARIAPGAESAEIAVETGRGLSNPISFEVLRYSNPAAGSEVVPGEVRVKLRNNADLSAVRGEAGGSAMSALFEKSADPVLSRWWRVVTTPGFELSEIREYAQDSRVEWAEPILLRPVLPEMIPNDTRWSEQWGPQKIAAPTAWDVTQGSSSVSIAVIDSGVVGHDDIGGHLLTQRDYTGSGLGDGCPTQSFGHATHVAGIASALTNNNKGVAGIGWNSSLRSYKIFAQNAQGSCLLYCGSIAQAITDAANDGSQVMNMSFKNCGYSQAEQDAVNYAWLKGVVPVAAAGNDGQNIAVYPAQYINVIAVAASDQSDNRASFSNFGAWVDVAAPGVSILSSVPTNAYSLKSGTSMATPHVAGVAALLKAVGLNNCAIERTIKATSDPINWQGGWGRLNAGRALTDRRYCRADIGIYNNANQFWVAASTGGGFGPTTMWSSHAGGDGNQQFAGDFNGDGSADVGNYAWNTNPPPPTPHGEFWVSTSTGQNLNQVAMWSWHVGGVGDQRFIADYNGDGKADVGNYVPSPTPSNGKFYVSTSTGAGLNNIAQWSGHVGNEGDVRFIADFNGDGRADIGNYVPANGQFWVSLSMSTGTGFQAIAMWKSFVGNSGDTRFIADYNGDGKADVGNYIPSAQPSNGNFKVYLSTGTLLLNGVTWSPHVGNANEERHIGDYNGDGKADVGNYVPANNQFWVSVSTGSNFYAIANWSNQVGGPGDVRYIADYNGDGRSDVGNYVPGAPYERYFYVSLSALTGFQPIELWTINAGWWYEKRFIADFNGN